MNWNQPICAECYAKRHPGRRPVEVIDASPEMCCDCGEVTHDGIYYRIDPRTVRFQTEEKSS